MRARIIIQVLFLIGILCFSVGPHHGSARQPDWWDDSWSFRQEINLASLTENNIAAYQPVDILIEFESLCWAINETRHSVRVICQNNNDCLELESQLYDLVSSDEAHITSCSLIFLIPPHADGTEQYYVYYDESPTASPEYPDYVSIEDSYYYYEPIPGYPLESSFYKISQNGTIPYVVAQEGTCLWYTTSQCVTKLKQGSTEVIPKNGESLASFEYAYYYGDEMWQFNSTSQVLISKEILCDGTLMVSCRLISRSRGDNLQTTAVYKYYYCPTSSQRIQVHVVHETLKDCHVYPGAHTDGTYAFLQCGGIQSASIADLNFGKLSPLYHVYSEHDTIEEYRVDLQPSYTKEDPVIFLIDTKDDVDLGKNAWVCYDEGTTGAVHAIIFGSSSVIKAGENERDGMQLKSSESSYPRLPGLDYTIATLEINRNAYEKDTLERDLIIPKGFIAEFDAEYFSSPVGGYPLVEDEAAFFQALVPMKPPTDEGQSSQKITPVDRFSLRVYVHNAPAFPFGSALSAVTGRYFPYTTVEVYRDNRLMYSGTAGHVPLKSSTVSTLSSLKDIILSGVSLIDFRNMSLFKRFHFQDLEAGRYVVKVFKENPLIGHTRRFIGHAIVDLTKDAALHVFCRPQGTCMVSLFDQLGKGVSGALVMLVSNGVVITQNTTDDTGLACLAAPCSLRDPYEMIIHYQGFEVVNETLRLGYGRLLIPLKKSITLEKHDWAVTLVDTWGLPLEIDVTPRLTSSAMRVSTVILPQKHGTFLFQFSDLIAATYHLQIPYKSFSVEKEIMIPADDESVVFPAEFKVSFYLFDSRGLPLDEGILQMNRGGKTVQKSHNSSFDVFTVPPGDYLVKVLVQDHVIDQRYLRIFSDRSVDLVTTKEPIFPILVMAIACLLILIGIALSFLKKDLLYLFFIITISVLLMSLVFPWWSLQGSSRDITTSSTLFLLPLNLVTTTMTSQSIAGELAFFPDIFITLMMIILIIATGICLTIFCLLVVHMKKKSRWQTLLIVGLFILLSGSLVLFIGAMSAFTEVGVGSLIGEGTLDITVYSEEITAPVHCQWGPGLGFWLFGLSGLFLVSTLFISVYEKRRKRTVND
ncbi:MAG: carboxypeptidase regulatory-like domain-containing protein [Candidatus Thermoplasmatota archaeon]|nr:carboxypeptidase regulatory-like domain-containing protein [Candidatus Thermoplasmatota archaeon]